MGNPFNPFNPFGNRLALVVANLRLFGETVRLETELEDLKRVIAEQRQERAKLVGIIWEYEEQLSEEVPNEEKL